MLAEDALRNCFVSSRLITPESLTAQVIGHRKRLVMPTLEETQEAQLALSGGGYRAMLFHVGALWRLNEFGQLSKMTHISSVSGGSIVAGVLAANWSHLDFDAEGKARAFNQSVVEPLIRLARKSIDYPAAALGLLPFVSAASLLARTFNKHVTSRKALADIPSSPRFIFNATNVQTGTVWTFQKDMMGDPIVGWQKPEVSLATAVAASSAFAPVLSPLTLEFPDSTWKAFPHQRYYDELRVPVERVRPDHLETLRKRVVLADGGIADNLGLIGLPPTQGNRYISDGGCRPSIQVSPWRNWVSQIWRAYNIIHDQPSQLRAYRTIAQMADHDECRTEQSRSYPCGDGAYWHMRWPPAEHREKPRFVQLKELEITKLSSIATKLRAMDDTTIMRLINWGYVAANRSLPYVSGLWKTQDGHEFNENSLPYPTAGFG